MQFLPYPLDWRPWITLLLLVTAWGTARPADAQGFTWNWVATGGGSQGSDLFDRVATDASGHVFVAGRMRKTATFGDTTLTATGNQDDLLVAKLSPAGGYEWVRRVGSTTDDEVRTLRVGTNGNVYLEGWAERAITFGSTVLPASGSTAGIGYVACLDGTTGVWLWAVRTPANSFSTAMVLDAANNVYVGGAFTDTASFGNTRLVAMVPGNYNMFVAKLSGAGTHPWQWAVMSGGSDRDERVTAMATDHAGNLYVGGQFSSVTVRFGTTTLTRIGSQDCFVAKLTTAGGWRWAKQIGGLADEAITAMDATATGGVVLSGLFGGPTNTVNSTIIGTTTLANAGVAATYDGFVAKINPAGTIQWATQMGGTKTDYLRTVVMAPTGEVYTTGFYDSPTVAIGDSTVRNTSASTNLADSFVAQLTAAGSTVTWKLLGHTTGGNCEFMLGSALDATGNLYVSGCFATAPVPTATLGPFTVSSTGYFDGFVTKLTRTTQPTALPDSVAPARLAIWPNPAPAAGTVRVGGAAGNPVELVDALGRVVRSVRSTGAEAMLGLAGVPAGVYSVRAGAAHRPLIVE